MSSILQIKQLTKKINGRSLLTEINLTINQTGIYGIVGRNGSGKSLLFKSIAGLLTPSEGSIEVFGEQIGKGVFPKNFGALLDTGGFLPGYSGYRNLKLLSSIQNKISEQEVKAAIKEVGLDPEDTTAVRKYSLGMKQRLGIAQAIMEKPDLLILDEPMNGLDETGVAEIRAMLDRFRQQGVTILLASHNSEDIQLLCDKVYRMTDGKLKELEL